MLMFIRDLNKLVMNYLVIEGYKEAAEKFQQESGADRMSPSLSQPLPSSQHCSSIFPALTHPPLSSICSICAPSTISLTTSFQSPIQTPFILIITSAGIDLSTISDRMAIRAAIQRGEVEEGIERVNDLNPEVRRHFSPLFSYSSHLFSTWFTYILKDIGYKPATVLSSTTTEADRVDSQREDIRSTRFCTRGNGSSRGRKCMSPLFFFSFSPSLLHLSLPFLSNISLATILG